MNEIALNFIPLVRQDVLVTVYRRLVNDTSQKKKDEDFRVKLPEQEADRDWLLFDVSTTKRDGYDAYEYSYSQNPVLTVHLIYKDLLNFLSVKSHGLKYHIPERAIRLKEIHFLTKQFDEGATEVIVKPHYLKVKSEYGLIVEHKFTLKEGQPFNRQTQIRSFSLDKSGKPNIYFYKDKKSVIESFLNEELRPLFSGSSLEIAGGFSDLPAKQLDVKTYLVGGGKTAKSQFMGIRSDGPYRLVSEKVRYLFVFTERTRPLARDIYLGLVGKLFPSQFSGLEKMFSLPFNREIVDHYLVETFDADAIRDIEGHVQGLQASHSFDKLMILAVLPKGFKGVDASFDAYGNLKLMSLRNGAYCQVITEDTFFKKDQLKWSVSNIGLQVFSKLGGAPWLVKPAKSNCLILGIGSVQEIEEGRTTRYTAYTVCLDSSGDFKSIKPLSSSSNEGIYLNSLRTNLNDVLKSELDGQYRSLVLHLPHKISRKEIEVIKEVVSNIKETDEFEIIIIRVNTKHKFLGFSEHNTCVPYESTYVQLSTNEFLIWAEGLQYGKEVLHKRVSEPLYVDFIESREGWMTKKECLQDILNLTGANWRGFNSKAQPISILYSRLIAKFMKEFSHLENVNDMSIVSAESAAPWFL